MLQGQKEENFLLPSHSSWMHKGARAAACSQSPAFRNTQGVESACNFLYGGKDIFAFPEIVHHTCSLDHSFDLIFVFSGQWKGIDPLI